MYDAVRALGVDSGGFLGGRQGKKQTAKKVRIDGFRPGKAPVAAVLKRYEKELEDDAKNDIFRNFVDESLKILKANLPVYERVENVCINDASGRILAIDLKAKNDFPRFKTASMDGYAVSFDDLKNGNFIQD